MKKGKKILAILGVVLLVGMYLATLLLAIFDRSASMSMFKAAAACTILVPIMLYAYTLVYKWTRDKHESDQD